MLAKFALLVFRVRSLLAGRPFRRFFAKPRNLNVSLRLTALSLTLSRGERGQIGWKSQTWLGFGILNPLSPWERVRERAANRQVCFLAILGRKTSSTLPFQHPLKPQQCQPQESYADTAHDQHMSPDNFNPRAAEQDVLREFNKLR